MSLIGSVMGEEYVVWVPGDNKSDSFPQIVNTSTGATTSKSLSDVSPKEIMIPTSDLLVDPSSIMYLKGHRQTVNVSKSTVSQSPGVNEDYQTFSTMVSARNSGKIIASLDDLRLFASEELGKMPKNDGSFHDILPTLTKDDPRIGELIYDLFHTRYYETIPSKNHGKTLKADEKTLDKDDDGTFVIYLPNQKHLEAWLLSKLLGKNTPNFPDVIGISVSEDNTPNAYKPISNTDGQNTVNDGNYGTGVRSVLYYEPVTLLGSGKRIPRNMPDIIRIFFESTFAALHSIQAGISMIDYDSFSIGKRHNPRRPLDVYKRMYNIDGVYYTIKNRANFGSKGKTDIIYKARDNGFIIEKDARLITDTSLRVLSRILPGKGGIRSPIRSSTTCADTKLIRDESKIDAGAIELWYLGIHLFNLCTGIKLGHTLSSSSSSSDGGDTSGYTALLHCLKIRKLLDPKGFSEFIEDTTNDFADSALWKKMVSSYTDGTETFSFGVFNSAFRKKLRKDLAERQITPLILQLTHYNPKYRFGPVGSSVGYSVSNGPLVSQSSIDTIKFIFSHRMFEPLKIRPVIDILLPSGKEQLKHIHSNPSVEWFWSDEKLELAEIESIIDALHNHAEEQRKRNIQLSLLESTNFTTDNTSNGTQNDNSSNATRVESELEKIGARHCATRKGSRHHTSISSRYPVAKTICSFCGYHEILSKSKQCTSQNCELSGRIYCRNEFCHKSDLANYRLNMGTIKMATMKH